MCGVAFTVGPCRSTASTRPLYCGTCAAATSMSQHTLTLQPRPRPLNPLKSPKEEYGSFQWDSTILSVDGDVESAVRELLRVATKLAGPLAFGRIRQEHQRTYRCKSW